VLKLILLLIQLLFFIIILPVISRLKQVLFTKAYIASKKPVKRRGCGTDEDIGDVGENVARSC